MLNKNRTNNFKSYKTRNYEKIYNTYTPDICLGWL